MNASPDAFPDAASLHAYLVAAHKPRTLDDILRELKLPRRSKKAVLDLLWELEGRGEVIYYTTGGGGAYVAAGHLQQVSGVLELDADGGASVLPESGGRSPVVCITPGNMGRAWRGDRVLLALLPVRGKGPHATGGRARADRGSQSGRASLVSPVQREGRVLEILEPGPRETSARVLRRLRDGTLLCEPLDPKLRVTFLTDASGLSTALATTPATPPRRDDILSLRVLENEAPGLWKAAAIRILGREDDLAVQEAIVKAAHGIAAAFPAYVTAEAAAFGDAPDNEALAMPGRRDLSRLPLVTIDGEDARDFDDAIHVAREGSGFRLHVAIADVAHYVRPGSALDTEACARGNSCYFPRSVEPMLPEALSAGLCSLQPGVPRLLMVAELLFDEHGERTAADFYPAWGISQARLTYELVQARVVDGRDNDGDAAPVPAPAPGPSPSQLPQFPMLRDALTLARVLRAARSARGSLDFDLPEPRYEFDAAGSLAAIRSRTNSVANHMIEEFMVAANEAVASFLFQKGVPHLYRVHPAPDPEKLKSFFSVVVSSGLARAKGVRMPFRTASFSARDLQALLQAARGTEQEYIVGRMLLRSMMQAAYAPKNDGHFGLASSCYCHFTSPIRRYADLVVHRALKAALNAADAPAPATLPGVRRLEQLAGQLRERERAALDAEREMARRLSAVYMRDKAGESFDGVISGLTDFGIFVELSGMPVEGLVRISSLGDDYYIFDQDRQELRGRRGGAVWRLGQAVRVTVVDVNPARQEITLELVPDTGTQRFKTQRNDRPGRKAGSGHGRPGAKGGKSPRRSMRQNGGKSRKKR